MEPGEAALQTALWGKHLKGTDEKEQGGFLSGTKCIYSSSFLLLFFLASHTVKSICVCAKSLQLCPTLCNPMDCSPPGSSVHGDSLGNNPGVDCRALLQGISQIQGSNSHLYVSCIIRQVLYHQSHLGNPSKVYMRHHKEDIK